MFTVVTGFFDIGRGEWQNYNRKIDEYLKNFENLLRLNVNMIIYIERQYTEFVHNIREDIPKKTTIITSKITDLYMYKYLTKIKEIQANPLYSIGHPNPSAPEICKPLYNIVTCSKMDMVAQATNYDHESDYFIWLDAGYTHSTVDLSKLDWNPTTLFEHKKKLAVIALCPLHDASDDPLTFFNQYKDVLIGGFFGGYRDTIKTVRYMYYQLVDEIFDKYSLKDDDQFYNTLLAKRNPELFQIYYSFWYGAMDFK